MIENIQFVNTVAPDGNFDGSMDAFTGALSLDTAKMVEAINITATLNGVVSNQKIIDISNLFGANTTAGKLRTDAEKVLRLDGYNFGTIAVPGITTFPLGVTLSQGVSMPEEISVGSPDGVDSATISAMSGDMVLFEIEGSMPTASGEFVFAGFTLSCDGTSYRYNRALTFNMALI